MSEFKGIGGIEGIKGVEIRICFGVDVAKYLSLSACQPSVSGRVIQEVARV